nr:MAG TPA: hypothetical protein [Caudoviricetes sp.]
MKKNASHNGSRFLFFILINFFAQQHFDVVAQRSSVLCGKLCRSHFD